MALLAITKFSMWTMLAALLLGLIMVAASCWLRRSGQGVALSPIALTLHSLLLFLGLTIWLHPILYLGAWGLWIGDNQHWFYGASPYVAGAIALGYASWFASVIRRRHASRTYLLLHRWSSIALLTMAAAAWVSEFAQPIVAREPITAAEAAWGGDKLNLREEPVGANFRKDREFRAFLVMGKNEPKGRVVVYRYARFWWAIASREGFRPSREALRSAKRFYYTRHDHALGRRMLEDMVRNYPGAEAAKEAERILEKTGRSPE